MNDSRNNRWILLLLLLPLCFCWTAESRRVLDVTEKNFPTIVNTKSLSLILFYSPGCQPCVEILVVMQRLAMSHAATHSDVKFGRVDVRQEPVLAMRFHADEVPVLKAFPHSSTPIAFYGAVTEEELVKFVRGLRLQSAVKTGLSKSGESLYGGSASLLEGGAIDSAATAAAETATVSVNASSYVSIILDNNTNAMLALHTPECGEPCAVYERIAGVFKHEDHHIVFGRADVTKEPELARFFQAQRNPTLLWFPRGDKNNIVRYGGDVDLHEIVGFINDMTGSHRQPDGRLETGAGRVPQIERLLRERASDLVLGRNIDHLVSAIEDAARELPHSKRYVQFYLRLMRQLAKGAPIDRILERENEAIAQLLSSDKDSDSDKGAGRISQAERDEAHKLHNIVSGVVDIVVEHLQGERRTAEEAEVRQKKRKMEEQRKLRREQEDKQQEVEEDEATRAGRAHKEEL